MVHIREIIHKQMQLYLSNWHYALLYTLILAVLPYTSWLAVSGISLLTLRRGLRCGAFILLPVAVVYYALVLKSLTHMGAFLNTCVLFIPCFIGALVLRLTSTWQAVSGVFFLLIAIIALAVQVFAPDFVVNQYMYLEDILQKSQSDAAIIKILADLSTTDKSVVASYAFGLQLLSIFLSAFISLIFARSMQSRIYNFGGFTREALGFRACKIAIFILFLLFLGAAKQNMLAMMLLPAVIIYFLLAGLSICASTISKKSSKLMFVVFVPIALMPVISVPFYSFLGLFDSLFSLRFYFFKRRS